MCRSCGGIEETRSQERCGLDVRHVCGNADALVLRRKSPLHVPNPDLIADKRVLVIEDGPTTTHGGMPFGAGVLAATEHHAAELVDPRPFAVGEIAETFEK